MTNVIRLKDTVPVIDDSDCDLDESPETPIVALSTDEQAVKQWVGRLDAHSIRRIGHVTGCSITPKLDSIGLLVKGATTVDTEKTLKKLETVASMMVSSASIAYREFRTSTHQFLESERVLPHHSQFPNHGGRNQHFATDDAPKGTQRS